MFRIAFVSYSYWPPDFGGELLISIERFKELARRGFSITVLTAGHPAYPGHESDDAINVWRSPAVGSSRVARAVRRLLFTPWCITRLQHGRFNVVHFGSFPPVGGAVGYTLSKMLMATCKARRMATVSVHSLADSVSEPFSTRGLARRISRAWLGGVDCIVGVSPALFDSLHAHFPQKAELITCGVRDDVFRPLSKAQRDVVRHSMGANENDVVFSFNGTVCIRKGFDTLRDAFLAISSRHPSWKLWVVGPTSHRENANVTNHEYASLVGRLRENPGVAFLGRIDNRERLAHVIGASDVFVFPTRREGMGLAPLEAMAAGVPVVVSRITGVTDLANIDEVTGLYVSPGDANELAMAMERLGQDAALRRSMGQAARQRIVESFGWQAHVDKWEGLYERLASSKRVRTGV